MIVGPEQLVQVNEDQDESGIMGKIIANRHDLIYNSELNIKNKQLVLENSIEWTVNMNNQQLDRLFALIWLTDSSCGYK